MKKKYTVILLITILGFCTVMAFWMGKKSKPDFTEEEYFCDGLRRAIRRIPYFIWMMRGYCILLTQVPARIWFIVTDRTAYMKAIPVKTRHPPAQQLFGEQEAYRCLLAVISILSEICRKKIF